MSMNNKLSDNGIIEALNEGLDKIRLLAQSAYNKYKDSSQLLNEDDAKRLFAEIQLRVLQENYLLREQYGWDDRLDLHQVHSTKVQANARAVGMLCRVDHNGQITAAPSWGIANNICAEARYYWHPCIPQEAFIGTAFLMSNDTIWTAKHLLDNIDLSSLRFVLGFHLKDAITCNLKFDIFELEGGTRNERRSFGNDGISSIKLKGSVRGVSNFPRVSRRSLKANRAYIIGHPHGLPLKIGMNGCDIKVSRQNVINLDIDAYDGNSGSPVFDADTDKLIGVFFKGAEGLHPIVDEQCSCSTDSPSFYRYTCSRYVASFPGTARRLRVLSVWP